MAIGKRLTTRDGGRITRLGFDPSSLEAGNPFIWMGLAGGAPHRDWYTWNGPVPGAHWNSPANVRGLEYYRTLVDNLGGVEQVSSFTAGNPAAGLPTLTHPLLNGRAAMVIDGSWTIATVKQYAPKLQYGVAALPRPDSGGAHFNISGGWAVGIPKGAQHPKEAWALIKLSMSPKWMRAWNEATAAIIPNIRIGTSDPVYSRWPYKLFQAEVPYSSSWPAGYFGWPTYDPSAAQQDVIYHRLSARAALDKTQSEAERIIKRYFGL